MENFFGASIPDPIHVCIMQLIMVLGFLHIGHAKVNLLNTSIMCRIHLSYHYFELITTAFLNSDTKGRCRIGQGGVF